MHGTNFRHVSCIKIKEQVYVNVDPWRLCFWAAAHLERQVPSECSTARLPAQDPPVSCSSMSLLSHVYLCKSIYVPAQLPFCITHGQWIHVCGDGSHVHHVWPCIEQWGCLYQVTKLQTRENLTALISTLANDQHLHVNAAQVFFKNQSSTWKVTHSTVMSKSKWHFLNGCKCKSLISTGTKFLNSCQDGINGSVCQRSMLKK
jgi:hypothetical protein